MTLGIILALSSGTTEINLILLGGGKDDRFFADA